MYLIHALMLVETQQPTHQLKENRFQVLRAAFLRWIPSDEEHHGWMLHDLARMTMATGRFPRKIWHSGKGVKKKTKKKPPKTICFWPYFLIPSFFWGYPVFLTQPMNHPIHVPALEDLPKTLPLPKRLGGRSESVSRASQVRAPKR